MKTHVFFPPYGADLTHERSTFFSASISNPLMILVDVVTHRSTSVTVVTIVGAIVVFFMHQKTSGMTKSHATAIVLSTFVLCDILRRISSLSQDYMMQGQRPITLSNVTQTIMHWTALLVVVYLVLKCFSITDM